MKGLHMKAKNQFGKGRLLSHAPRQRGAVHFGLLLLLCLPIHSPGQTYSILHTFTGSDGGGPSGTLVSSGTALYGTAGGGSAGGTVFRVNKDGSGYTVLHNFTGSDGTGPGGGLTLAGATLYGATGNDPGTVFRIETNGSGFTLLRAFNGSDGRWPCGGLALSGTALYGVTGGGGTLDRGTVFKMNSDGSAYAVLHSFGSYLDDGSHPDGGFLLSGTTLYGATELFGRFGCGTLFKINIDGSGYTILRQFAPDSGGWEPYCGLILAGTTLYGTTLGGYSNSSSTSYSGGKVFKVNTDGTGYSVLHNFSGSPDDGAQPYGGLVLSGAMLYGTTGHGGYSASTGDFGYGTIFMVRTNGSGYAVLRKFTGADGYWPAAGLLLDGTTLYGTTCSGGLSSNGVVFALTLPSPPTILIPPATQTAEVGTTRELSVKALGSQPLAYKWSLNGTIVPSATNSVLQLKSVQPSDEGAYTVLITNASGAVTSPPATLAVIHALQRRLVPALSLVGETGVSFHLENRNALDTTGNWLPLDTVTLTNPPQWYFDLTLPLPSQRFYRVWQTGSPVLPPSLDLPGIVPAITLTGNVGDFLRLDYINQVGPIDAWVTLATVTLTNSSQLYFDTSVIDQPPRLYRIVPLP